MFIFKVNDYVVYGLTGVCQITDITKDEYINVYQTEYYVLNPVYENKMTIKTPVNNKKVFMRKIMTKDDVLSLIESMPKEETVWIDDDRQRSEKFKVVLKTGKNKDLVKVIKTIYLKKQEKSAVGKKLMKIDEDTMKIAEYTFSKCIRFLIAYFCFMRQLCFYM